MNATPLLSSLLAARERDQAVIPILKQTLRATRNH